MAKKEPSTANGKPLATVIRESANQIWLAGLGALAKSDEKGGDWFKNLISAGGDVERAAKEQITRPIRAAERKVADTRGSIEETWTTVVLAFERRVAKLLNSFQIPTSRDVLELTRRVEELQKAISDLEQDETVARSSRTRSGGVTKGARAARKKTPARTRPVDAETAGRTKAAKAGRRTTTGGTRKSGGKGRSQARA